jgi:hypothetical protein
MSRGYPYEVRAHVGGIELSSESTYFDTENEARAYMVKLLLEHGDYSYDPASYGEKGVRAVLLYTYDTPDRRVREVIMSIGVVNSETLKGHRWIGI